MPRGSVRKRHGTECPARSPGGRCRCEGTWQIRFRDRLGQIGELVVGEARGQMADPDRRHRHTGVIAHHGADRATGQIELCILQGPAALSGEGEILLQLSAIGDRLRGPGIEHHLVENGCGCFRKEGLAEGGGVGGKGAARRVGGPVHLLDEDRP